MLLNISQLTEVITEVALPCNKCNGSGYLQEHRRIASGVCFKCDGKGTSNKVKTIKTEKVADYETTAEILEDNDTFEAMLERHQANQDKAYVSGEFNIFDYFNAQ